MASVAALQVPGLGVVPVLRVLRDFAVLPSGQLWSAVVMPRLITLSSFIRTCSKDVTLLAATKQVVTVSCQSVVFGLLISHPLPPFFFIVSRQPMRGSFDA